MRAFLIIVVVFAILIAGAFFLHWINVSAASKAGDSSPSVTVTLDKNKVKEDINAVRQKAQRLEEKAAQKAETAREAVKERVDSLAGTATLTAVIVRIDAANHEVAMTNQDDSVVLTVTPQTKIQRGGKDVRLDELVVGQMAKATYTAKDQNHPAQEIKVIDGY